MTAQKNFTERILFPIRIPSRYFAPTKSQLSELVLILKFRTVMSLFSNNSQRNIRHQAITATTFDNLTSTGVHNYATCQTLPTNCLACLQQETRTLTKALRSVLPIAFARTRYCRLPICQSVSPRPLLQFGTTANVVIFNATLSTRWQLN